MGRGNKYRDDQFHSIYGIGSHRGEDVADGVYFVKCILLFSLRAVSPRCKMPIFMFVEQRMNQLDQKLSEAYPTKSQ